MINKYAFLAIAGIFTALPAVVSSQTQEQSTDQKKPVTVEIIIHKDGETRHITKEFDPADISESEIKDLENIDLDFANGEMDVVIRGSGSRPYSYSYSFGDEGNFDFEEFRKNHRQIAEGGQRVFLGVMGKNRTEEEGGHILIETVIKGSAAEKAGLKGGDILMTLDGESIGDMQELVNELMDRKPEDVVKVELLRDGKKETFSITLGERRDHIRFNTVCYDDANFDHLRNLRFRVYCRELGDSEKAMLSKKLGVDLNSAHKLTTEEIRLFPNPTQGQFSYELETASPGEMQVRVYSLSGQLVSDQRHTSNEGNFKGEVDLADSPAGEYLVVFKQGEKIATEKVMKH